MGKIETDGDEPLAHLVRHHERPASLGRQRRPPVEEDSASERTPLGDLGLSSLEVAENQGRRRLSPSERPTGAYNVSRLSWTY